MAKLESRSVGQSVSSKTVLTDLLTPGLPTSSVVWRQG
jgi:hypothetical protein